MQQVVEQVKQMITRQQGRRSQATRGPIQILGRIETNPSPYRDPLPPDFQTLLRSYCTAPKKRRKKTKPCDKIFPFEKQKH